MAGSTLGQAGQLIAKAREVGWGITFDENRHGQWRISRVVEGETHELIADSDGDVACRLAMAEIDVLIDGSAGHGAERGAAGTTLTVPPQVRR